MSKIVVKGPRSPARVMHLLEELASETEDLSLAKLSVRLETPKTSLLSLLRSLEAEGYVEVHNKAYRLGARTFRLGNLLGAKMKAWSSFPSAVRPFLLALSEESGETVLSGVLAEEKTHGVFIDMVEGSGSVHLSSVIGAHRPLYCTSFGKALLAFQSIGFIHSYLETVDLVSPLTGEKFKKETVFEDLSEIRKTGTSVTMGDTVEGAGGVGVPVFGAEGEIMGCIVLAASVDRLKANLKKYCKLTHAVGERASQYMGYAMPYPGAKK